MSIKQKYLIVTAGGTGTRMGTPVPKQFLMLGGLPVLQMTIRKFIDSVPGLKVITVLPEDYIELWKNLCYDNNFTVPQTIVKGGLTRFHSVKNALEKVPDGVLVAVHDGVRPFVSSVLLETLFREAGSCPGIVPAIPCVDTLRPIARSAEGKGLVRLDSEPVDRSRVFAVQTPQIFQSEVIKQSYMQAFDTSFTDDASVVEKAGFPVKYIEGERFNIKLTTPEDMRLAELVYSLYK